MKKIVLLITLVFICTFAGSLSFATSAFAALGDSDNPRQLSSCGDLELLNTHPDDYFEITTDITCTGMWTAIENSFTGNLDGQDHTIDGIQIGDNGIGVMGFFRSIGSGGVVKNLSFTNFDIFLLGYQTVGGVAGASAGEIDGVHVQGNVGGGQSVGGLVGINNGGYIHDSSTNVHVEADSHFVGGLVGSNEGAGPLIEDSSATGDVEGNENVGGLIGLASSSTTVRNSFATGDVECIRFCGGLVGGSVGGTYERDFATGDVEATTDFAGGFVGYSDQNSITNSYARGDATAPTQVGSFGAAFGNNNPVSFLYGTGEVTATGDEAVVGGLFPDTAGPFSDHSYWDVDTTGIGEPGDLDPTHAVGKSTSVMKSEDTFVDWDFEDIWAINPFTNDGYPYLINNINEDVPNETELIEMQGPNDGDANNDGTPDVDQDNVVSMRNSQLDDGSYVVLEFPQACENQFSATVKESQYSHQDADYDYPGGLLVFQIDCGDGGETVTIRQYYYGLDMYAQDFIGRKIKDSTGIAQTLLGASITDVVIGGQNAVKLTYSITDNGEYDDAIETDGIIFDPAGLAYAPPVATEVVPAPVSGTLAATGQELRTEFMYAVILTVVGLMCLTVLKRRKFIEKAIQ